MKLPDADMVLVGLLEAIFNRLADLLKRAGREIDAVSATVFRRAYTKDEPQDFQSMLENIGRKGDLNFNITDSSTQSLPVSCDSPLWLNLQYL